MKPPTFDPQWSDEIKALYRHDVQEIWDRSIARQMWHQYHNQLDIYLAISGEYRVPSKILDVGCAQGTLALLLAERGHDVVAVDLRQPFLDYAQSRYTHGDIRFKCANALDLDLDETFDLIFANQIIEHLVYPEQLIRRLRRHLRPEGRLVVTTPNWHYALNRLPSFDQIGDPSSHEAKQFTADSDGHFYAYTAQELKRTFAGEGLAHVRVRYFESPFISGHLKIRHLHRLVPIAVLRRLDRVALATPLCRQLAHQLMVVGQAA